MFGYGDNGPLYVTYYEKYNITGNATGEGVITPKINNITGILTINNTGDNINDTLLDVWIAMNISKNESGLVVDNPYKLNYTIYTSYSSNWAYTELPNNVNTYIHIPTLPNGTYLIFKIDINESEVGTPLIITETYSATKIPARKNANWSVTINISRNVSALPSTDTAVLVNMTKYLSNTPADYGDGNWTFLNITAYENSTGSVTLWNANYFTGVDTNDSLNWTDVILNSSQNASITINITGKYDYANRTAILTQYGFAVIFFEFNGTASGSHLDGVYATGMCGVSAYKEGPEMTGGEYKLWYEQANVTNNAKNYYFNLTKVTIWAVNGSNPTKLDPFNTTLWITTTNGYVVDSNHTYTLSNVILAPGEFWNTSKEQFYSEDIPVVWANCSFRVVESNITLINKTVHEISDKYGSSYIIVEEIYVIGSYLIKVTKHIVPNDDGTYSIYIVVENIGGEKTPDYVYVYDLIPNNFNISDIWVNQSGMLAQKYNGVENFTGNNTVSDPRYKACYYWALHEINPGANGDGWWNSTEITKNETVVIHYTLNGTGEFYPSDIFVVGIDPTNSLLPTTSPKITAVSGAVENNYEPLLALLTAMVGLGTIIRLKKYAL